jgi:L-amino acid N-acyltransferase YncA
VHLIDDLQQRGMHSVIAGISLPNPASVLHEKFGMTKVAHFKEVGFNLAAGLMLALGKAAMNKTNQPDDNAAIWSVLCIRSQFFTFH